MVMDSALATSGSLAAHAWYEAGAGLVASGGRLVADHLWQSTLFAVAVLALVRLLPSAPARLRYNLYLLATFKFFLPSAAVLGVLSRLPFAPAESLRGGLLPETLRPWLDFGVVLAVARRFLGLGAGTSGGNGLEHLSPALWWSLATVWLTVVLALAVLWISRLRRLRAVVAGAEGVVDDSIKQALERGRHRLRLRRPVRLVTTDEVVEPGVWGILWPVVVLPSAMPRHLAAGELESVLLHELLHVRRWDNLIGHVLLLLRCVLWFHPLVWWLDRRSLAERELACDERVVELAGNADCYLRGLAKVLRFGAGWRLALPTGDSGSAAGWSSAAGSDLGYRLRRLRHDPRRVPSLLHRGVVATAGALLLLSSLATGPLCAVDAPLRVMARTAAQVLSDSGWTEPSLTAPPESPVRSHTSSCPRSAASATVIKQCDSRQDR